VAFQDVRPNAGLQDYITQHARLFIVLSSCFCMIGYGTYCCLIVCVCWVESFRGNSNEIFAHEMHMLNIDGRELPLLLWLLKMHRASVLICNLHHTFKLYNGFPPVAQADDQGKKTC
jgi:hypothetical protein